MPQITFKIATHAVRPGIPIVEVFLGDRMLATVYPDSDMPALRIVSKHLNPATAVLNPLHPRSVLLPLDVEPA